MNVENTAPNFCSDCGFSLVLLDTWCTSRDCSHCGKEVFFVNRGEDGGIKVEKGEKFHIPNLTISIDPRSGGQFTRFGLEGYLKNIFLGKAIEQNEFIEYFKELEKNLDKELNGLDCISHCDLNDEKGVADALKILKSEGLLEYLYNLHSSCAIRACITAINEGHPLNAAYYAHIASKFKEFSLLESPHLKEIIWNGYLSYVDLTKNEELNEQSAKEKRLLNGAITKIKSFDTGILSAYVNDGREIGPRLSLTGIEETTLKALVNHELSLRDRDREERLKLEELRPKKIETNLKVWGAIFTAVNFIIALYGFKIG